MCVLSSRGKCEPVRTICLASWLLWLAACSTIPQETEAKLEPVPVVTESAQPAAPPPQSISPPQTHVAILDPDNDADALARHWQALLETSDDALNSNDVGYYIDILEARLIQQVRDNSVSVTRKGNTFTLLIAGSETFDSNRSRLKPGVKDSLASITGILEEYRNILISIFGHTDSAGDARYNQRLSEWRAQSVAQYLIDGGVAARRMVIIGYGETRPSATNETAEGRSRNRRVELLLAPLAK